MDHLDTAALAATAALVAFHVYEVVTCAKGATPACTAAQLSRKPTHIASRMHAIVLCIFFVIVPLALAYNFKISTLGIGVLVACVLTSMQAYVFGCNPFARTNKSALCKPNLERLFAIASCAGLISLPLHYMLT